MVVNEVRDKEEFMEIFKSEDGYAEYLLDGEDAVLITDEASAYIIASDKYGEDSEQELDDMIVDEGFSFEGVTYSKQNSENMDGKFVYHVHT